MPKSELAGYELEALRWLSSRVDAEGNILSSHRHEEFAINLYKNKLRDIARERETYGGSVTEQRLS